MNKTIMFLGMLAVGFANAQEGRVGVNTDAPKATLEVQPTATNLAGTTNEGIVAPKLSKTRVAAIATPVEGTLVYVTNEVESLITAYTGTDSKVAKIDEKGYYYFDGTEWVKVKNALQDQEWVYDPTTKQINLKRSGQTQGFTNKVYYNAETGQFINKDADQIDSTSKTGVEVLDGSGIFNLLQRNSNSISSGISPSGNKSKKLYSNILYVNESSPIVGNFLPSVQGNAIVFAKANKTPSHWVTATGNVVIKLDETTANYVMAEENSVHFLNGNIKNYAMATRSNININNPNGEIGSVYGAASVIGIGDVKKISTVSGVNSYIALSSNNIGNKIDRVALFDAGMSYYQNINPNIDELVGYYYKGTVTSGSQTASAANTKVHYGMYLGNIERAADNYAIYTNKGKVTFGDITKVKSTVYAPESSLTVHDISAVGDNGASHNRSIFTGVVGGKNPIGHFIGFGVYPNNGEGKFYAAADYSEKSKNRFVIFNNSNFDGKVYFSPFVLNDGTQKQDFNPVVESAITIEHTDGKKVGIGTNSPTQKLDVAGAIKIGTTDTCDGNNRGTIRFVDDKFQGCRSTGWVDLHN